MRYKDLSEEKKQYRREYNRKWNERNPEYHKEYNQRPDVKKRKKEYYKKRYLNHREETKKHNKEWRKENPEYNREYMREYRKTEKNKKYQREYGRKWQEDNPEYRKEYEKNRKANDPKYRLNSNIAIAIGFALKGNKAGKHWETLVGYTLQNLIDRLELNFDENMNWNNYGSYWWIDHWKPQSLFHYTTPEDQAFKDCWALCNLQPMEKIANIIKGNKF